MSYVLKKFPKGHKSGLVSNFQKLCGIKGSISAVKNVRGRLELTAVTRRTFCVELALQYTIQVAILHIMEFWATVSTIVL